MASPSSPSITLLDLPSQHKTCWSLNPWKTRLLLNYKKIPYTTRWTSYPDVQSTIQGHVTPHEPGTAINNYTIPTIIIPASLAKTSEDVWIMESLRIAEEIEKLFPEPALQIHSPALDEVIERIKKISPASAAEYMQRIPSRILGEPDKSWWYPDREAKVGMPLQQLEDEKGGQAVTEKVGDDVRAVTKLLEKNRGPFFEGKRVSYSDFVWGAFLEFLWGIGEKDTYENVIGKNDPSGVHRRLLEAVKREGLFDRDDH